jgi:hypothetical protein
MSCVYIYCLLAIVRIALLGSSKPTTTTTPHSNVALSYLRPDVRCSVKLRLSFTFQWSSSRTNVSRPIYTNNNNSRPLSLHHIDGSYQHTSSKTSAVTASSYLFNPWLKNGGLFANSTRRGKYQHQQPHLFPVLNDSLIFDSSPMRSSSSTITGLTHNNIAVSLQPYKVGENMPIKPIYEASSKYGYVPDNPRCQIDECYGPYQYVIASVQRIH